MPPSLTAIAAQVRYDLKVGRCWAATFVHPEGELVMEYRTPRGVLHAERPRLVLWQQGEVQRILVDLDLSTPDRAALERDLDGLLTRGGELAEDDRPLYDLLLQQIRAHHLGRNRRARVPTVGTTVTEVGTPSLEAWASCLTLADLQDSALSPAA